MSNAAGVRPELVEHGFGIQFEDGLVGWVEYDPEEDLWDALICYEDGEICDVYPIVSWASPDDAFRCVQRLWNGTYDEEEACPCADCGVETVYCDNSEYYMVKDAVWEASGMGFDDGYLCIGCLQHRLGRPLIRADFTDVPVNIPGKHKSDRLNSILTGGLL